MENAAYTTVTLSWMRPNPPNGIIIGYQLAYRRTNDSSFILLLPSNNEVTRTVTELLPNTEYQFRVAAVTIVGRGPYTDITQSTTSELNFLLCMECLLRAQSIYIAEVNSYSIFKDLFTLVSTCRSRINQLYFKRSGVQM